MSKLGEPYCQVCGCTNSKACIVEGEPCHWIAEGVLCSACLPKIIMPRSSEESAMAFAPLMNRVLRVEIPLPQAFQIMALLQCVSRRPDLGDTIKETGVMFARGLQQEVSLTPTLAALAEAGWNPIHDAQAERRIILPRGER